eukprot:4891447-Pyramimonas_sp.AAC.1
MRLVRSSHLAAQALLLAGQGVLGLFRQREVAAKHVRLARQVVVEAVARAQLPPDRLRLRGQQRLALLSLPQPRLKERPKRAVNARV